MLINFVKENDREKRRARGEKVPDPDEQYQQLLNIKSLVEERYQSGAISREDYENYLAEMKDYEEN